MKKLIALFASAVLLLSVVSCGARSSTTESGNAPGRGPIPPMTTAPPPTITQAVPGSPGSGGGSQDSFDIAPRLIVRNGDIRVMVDDIQTAIGRIAQLAQQKGGFVVTSQVSPSGLGVTGLITIRVPAEEFDNTLKEIASLAVEVKSQSTSSKDVTQEYTDLNSRLTNLQATEQQYLRILEKAATVEEILNVQKELSNTREQIEVAKGQIQYLEQTSAMSLINVGLEQSRLIAEIVASRTVVDVDQSVSFSPDVAGGFAPLSYQWTFGDKSTSSEANPSHSYGSAGNYRVTLKVTDSRGSSVTDEMNIVVSGGWNGGSVARSAWRALVTFGKVLVNVGIWLGVFSPVWIVVGGVTWFFYRRSKRKQQVKPPTGPG